MKLPRLMIASLFIILLASHSISGRLLSTNQGSPLEDTREDDTLNQLMGLEECNKADDEECVERRMIAEAHLDYIYTQRHKPKP